MNPIDIQAKLAACVAAVVLLLIVTTVHGRASSFYPACLKPDGDWLHGVTRKECVSRDLKGRWYKKARKVM